MGVWFSEFHVRTLAERITPRIAPSVETAILAAVRAELPRLLMEELRTMLPEHTPKGSGVRKSERNALIRARYTGNNVATLAKEFGLHPAHVRKLVKE
jgi:Mor family transcriptional regulator